MLVNADGIRPMLTILSHPKPLPTRKADMVGAVVGHLSGRGLRQAWDLLDETQQLAVRETLHGAEPLVRPGPVPGEVRQVAGRLREPRSPEVLAAAAVPLPGEPATSTDRQSFPRTCRNA